MLFQTGVVYASLVVGSARRSLPAWPCPSNDTPVFSSSSPSLGHPSPVSEIIMALSPLLLEWFWEGVWIEKEVDLRDGHHSSMRFVGYYWL